MLKFAIIQCDLLKDTLEHKTRRNHALPLHLQIIISLRYFATGSLESVLGNMIHVDQCTVSRTIKRTTVALLSTAKNFIIFPTGDAAVTTKQQFFALAGFPNVLGAVDGTHIRIRSPGGGMSQCFYCRKGYPSINVQVNILQCNYLINKKLVNFSNIFR
jgi:nuclease HARBI1